MYEKLDESFSKVALLLKWKNINVFELTIFIVVVFMFNVFELAIFNIFEMEEY